MKQKKCKQKDSWKKCTQQTWKQYNKNGWSKLAEMKMTEEEQHIDLRKIRETFAKDRFATENGAIIEEVREHYARCSIELTERHFNAAGGVMGGVHFVLADFTFAVATNWNGMGVVSLSSTISYLGAVKGKKLIAEAECVKEGRSTVYYRVNVTDDLGNRIAEVGINGFRKIAQ